MTLKIPSHKELDVPNSERRGLLAQPPHRASGPQASELAGDPRWHRETDGLWPGSHLRLLHPAHLDRKKQFFLRIKTVY